MKLEQINRASGAAIGFVIAIVLFVVLALAAKLLVQVPAIDADRAELRGKALAEMRANEEKALTTTTMLDRQRGTVLLPIETAMKIAAEKWSTPGAARADLATRVDKALAPIKPVSFE
ncbi:MAG: hypothetical protein P4N60_15335 [Verrucomicrobiae bacterium]|nr:hypothetical protein [Verrucomicrobiae bacterium]